MSDARARAMLASFRAATSPTRATEDAALAAVEARLVAGAEEEPSIESTPSSILFHLRSAALALAIAAAVLLAIRAATFGASSLSAAETPMRDAASDTPVPERTARPVDHPPPAVAPPVPRPTPAVAPPIEPPAPVLTPSERKSVPSPARTDDLVAEVALVRSAKAERDDTAALALLDRHAREFPNGALARERTVLRAERLCALGRAAEARALADRFLVAHANDPLAARMTEVCRAK